MIRSPAAARDERWPRRSLPSSGFSRSGIRASGSRICEQKNEAGAIRRKGIELPPLQIRAPPPGTANLPGELCPSGPLHTIPLCELTASLHSSEGFGRASAPSMQCASKAQRRGKPQPTSTEPREAASRAIPCIPAASRMLSSIRRVRYHHEPRRSGRVAEGGALLRRYGGECLHRGFESLLLRFTIRIDAYQRTGLSVGPTTCPWWPPVSWTSCVKWAAYQTTTSWFRIDSPLAHAPMFAA